eukprot:g204.t1
MDEFSFAVPELSADPLSHHSKRVGLGTFTWNLIDNAPKPIVIPPVVSTVHPKLAVDDYLRYRRDPLFLFKTTSVCENCFLAYADIAVADMRQPILMPGDHADFVPTSGAAGQLTISQLRKQRGTALNRKRVQKAGRKSLRRSSVKSDFTPTPAGEMPEGMPPDRLQFDKDVGKAPGLDNFSRIDLDTLPEEQRHSVMQRRGVTQRSEGGYSSPPASAYQENDVDDVVPPAPSRSLTDEELLAKQGQSRVRIPPKSDPLYHVVKTDKDIRIAPSYKLPELRGAQREQRQLLQSVRSGGGAGGSERESGRRSGRRGSDKLRPYAKSQVLKHTNGTMVIRARRSLIEGTRASGRSNMSARSGYTEGSAGYEDVADISNLSESALEHRNFLMETLKQVKRQLEVPETLLTGPIDDGMDSGRSRSGRRSSGKVTARSNRSGDEDTKDEIRM